MIKDIQEGYLISSYFKDICLYLAQNKLPKTESAISHLGPHGAMTWVAGTHWHSDLNNEFKYK